MQRVPVGIDGYERGKPLHFELPDRFGRAKLFEEENVADGFDAFREHLSGSADRMEVNAAPEFECLLVP